MSKTFYLNCPSLHSLPKLVLRKKNILVGNGQYVGILFVIPVVINLHEHKFEAYTLVSEIHVTVIIVMCVKLKEWLVLGNHVYIFYADPSLSFLRLMYVQSLGKKYS